MIEYDYLQRRIIRRRYRPDKRREPVGTYRRLSMARMEPGKCFLCRKKCEDDAFCHKKCAEAYVDQKLKMLEDYKKEAGW